MIRHFRGTDGNLGNRRFIIVVSQYHQSITSKLLEGAIETLVRNDVPEEQVRVIWVPGAWEIPLAVKSAFQAQTADAAICLGCVIRGETTHDQHINTTVSNGLGQLSLDHDIPIGFGVLTCNTMDQAIQRSGGDVGNKGVEAAEAVIQMLRIQTELSA